MIENKFTPLENVDDLELLIDGDQVLLFDGSSERQLIYFEEESGGQFYEGILVGIPKALVIESNPRFQDGKIITDIDNFYWMTVPKESYIKILNALKND